MAWVWRKTRMAETNFSVNYARSKNLLDWEDSHGNSLTLPLTPVNAEVVDAVPAGSGLFNNIRMGFDASGAPVISYLKYDDLGYSQLYHARVRSNSWQIAKSTSWTYRWAFRGDGTIPSEISFGGVRAGAIGLVENVSHSKYGNRLLRLDANTLNAIESSPTSEEPKSDIPIGKLQVFKPISATARPNTTESVPASIHWETLGIDNNDQPRNCPNIGLPIGCSMATTMYLLTHIKSK
jgi:BNR repeat-containing family member